MIACSEAEKEEEERGKRDTHSRLVLFCIYGSKSRVKFGSVFQKQDDDKVLALCSLYYKHSTAESAGASIDLHVLFS